MKKRNLLCAILACVMLLCCISLVSCDGEESKKTTYGVTIGGVVIELDAEAEAILTALGAWKTYDASPTCAYEGEDKVYGYGSFDVQTYTLGGKDYIHSVYLLDDTHATREGISVGSTRDGVVEAYGTPTKETAGALIYEGNAMTLTFLLRDGTVTAIQYVKSDTASIPA